MLHAAIHVIAVWNERQFCSLCEHTKRRIYEQLEIKIQL